MTTPPGRQALRALEALLFVSDEPVTAVRPGPGARGRPPRPSTGCATDSPRASRTAARGSSLRNVAGGWRLYTHPDAAPIVEQFVLSSRQARLTKAALETLAIVAYKQPVTRHQVSAIRGVNSDGVLRALRTAG